MNKHVGTETIRQWALKDIGRSNLELVEAAKPVPADNEVLVKIAAVSLNYRDNLLVETGLGFSRPNGQPMVPGSDAAGEVAAVGSAVTRFKPGDQVISTFMAGWVEGLGPGTARQPTSATLGGPLKGLLADYAVLDQECWVKAPKSLNAAAASTLVCAGLTAWTALVERGRLRAGQTVVVQGTGGVALFGLQIAAAHGAETLVISGDDAKLERAKALGATHGINRHNQDWVEAVWEMTGDRGADHILEIIGGAHLGKSLEAAAVGGRVSLIGILEGFDVSGSFAMLARKRLIVEGIQVGHRRSLEDLVRAVDRAGIKPVIDAEYEMADLPVALDHLARGPFGKIVVAVNPKK
ncbi:zinc-dependent alcohol dehydrogenase family protein [Mesorhizobium sp. B1-1-8]|uniref:zinc-dependent alcohol dehydrogenase family protein n=1 Tax=Mesorhizobium sp. B1-1-8 TaxID=2589976 RepID=UPI001126828F|nr:NAD(P)-dependent alcohol dehydrogenase [Mesorhizobium sp. B1-1-8]UCI07057.1 NAD(P)-dependent alcohol dehydrogenase [Mesorhizobium sp. B1-1-8]